MGFKVDFFGSGFFTTTLFLLVCKILSWHHQGALLKTDIYQKWILLTDIKLFNQSRKKQYYMASNDTTTVVKINLFLA